MNTRVSKCFLLSSFSLSCRTVERTHCNFVTDGRYRSMHMAFAQDYNILLFCRQNRYIKADVEQNLVN